MKTTIFILVLLFVCTESIFGQEKPDIKKNPSPFTILIEDQRQKQWYAVSQLETTIQEWVQMIKGIAYAQDDLTVQDGANAMGYTDVHGLFLALLPDTSLMKPEAARFFAPMIGASSEENFDMAAFYTEASENLWSVELPGSIFANLPITGISFEQAELFCKWCTYMVEQSITTELMNNDGRLDKYNKDYFVAIRLATPEEFDYWLMCERVNVLEKQAQAQAMLNIVEKGLYPAIDSMNAKGCALWNFRIDKPCESVSQMREKHGDRYIPSGYFFPSSLGLYDVMGNVAEMTSVKGVAKGGSYAHYAHQSMPNRQQMYEKPADWLGFRYVITFQKKP